MKDFENNPNTTGDRSMHLTNSGKILLIPSRVSTGVENIVLLAVGSRDLLLSIDKICKKEEIQFTHPIDKQGRYFKYGFLNVVIDDNANKVTIKTNCKKEVTINLKDLTIENIIPYDPNNICDNLYNPCWTKFELLKNHLRCYVKKTKKILGFEK